MYKLITGTVNNDVHRTGIHKIENYRNDEKYKIRKRDKKCIQ